MKKPWISGLMLIRIVMLTVVLVAAISSPLGLQPSGWPEVKAHAQKENSSQRAGEDPARAFALMNGLSQVSAAGVAATVTAASSAAKAEASSARDASHAALAAAKPQKQTEITEEESGGKTVYLTFDDGPGPLTDQVLEILQDEGVTATFFVLGQQAKRSPEVIRRIVDGGHALGNHTYNHDYDALYDSFGHFWKQIKATEEVLREITGSRTQLVRAPGGTYGHFDKTYFSLLEQGGYKVFDWNVDSGDSKRKGVPASEIVSNVVTSKLQERVVVLMHDGGGHAETVKALPQIIKFYKKQGYAFRTLSPDQKPVQFTLDPSMDKKHRSAPSEAWVLANVAPNAALFAPDLPLTVEAGSVQTRLDAGEYAVVEGQYLVPVRTAMERLGAGVYWSEPTQSAFIVWGDSSVVADTRRGVLTAERADGTYAEYAAAFERKNDALWVPLRPLLEAVGHPILKVSSTPEERRVKAL
ncbi:polysaccharide deacetylase family protein [Paenibacillus macerans]|uniref:polysaccharide deacetylase n=1 Tax=Paenibacillus macerans TaxID=44252 RepID=UPI003D3185B4